MVNSCNKYIYLTAIKQISSDLLLLLFGGYY